MAGNRPTQIPNVGFEGGATSKFIELDGGLDVKSDPFSMRYRASGVAYTSNPSATTTTATNIWYMNPGQIRSLPPFSSAPFANYTTLATYGVYPLDPTEPYVTGDIMVWAEVADSLFTYNASQPTSSPKMQLGSGFNQPKSADPSPSYPYQIRTKAVNGAMGETFGYSYENGGIQPIFLVARSGTYALTIAYYAIGSSGTALQGYYAQFVDLQGNALTSPAFVGQFGLSCDAIEFAATPNSFLVAGDNPASTSTQIFTVAFNPSFYNPITVTTPSVATVANLSTDAICQTVALTNFNGVTYMTMPGKSGTSFVVINTVTAAGGVTSTVTTTIATNTTRAYSSIATATDGTYFFILYVFGQSGSVGRLSLYKFNSITTTPSQTQSNIALTGTAGGSLFQCSLLVSNGIWYAFFTRAILAATSINTTSVNSLYGTYASGALSVVLGQGTFQYATGSILITKAFQLTGNSALITIQTGYSNGQSANGGTYFGQPCMFVIDHNCSVVSRLDPIAAVGNPNQVFTGTTAVPSIVFLTFIPSTVSIITTPNSAVAKEAIIPYYKLIAQGFNAGTNLSITLPTTGVSTTLTLAGAPNWVAAQLWVTSIAMPANLGIAPVVKSGKGQVIAGALTKITDGIQSYEAGWHLPPEQLGLVSVGAGGSAASYPAGTYIYTAVFTFEDANGLLSRSAPSTPVYVTQAAGWQNQVVQVDLPITFRSGLIIQLYRADAGVGTYYLVNQLIYSPSGIPGAAATLSVQITDNVAAPSSAKYSFPLYISSQYESSPPPAFVWQCVNQGRHWGIANIDGTYRAYFSTVYGNTTAGNTSNIAPTWNVGAYVQCPPELGDIRSCAGMDSYILLLGTRGVGYISGIGPSSAPGSNGIDADPGVGFNLVAQIPAASPVVGSGCPVVTGLGCYYQGSQGITLISRSLEVTFVGMPVDQITGVFGQQQVTYGTATNLPKLQSIVFCNPSGDSLVYNESMSKWSTWQAASYGPIASICQRLDGNIMAAQQSVSGATLPQTFSLNGSAINNCIGYMGTASLGGTQTAYTLPTFVVETPWLLIGDSLVGEGNVWDALVLGTFENPHILQVETAVNGLGYTAQGGSLQQYPMGSAPVNSPYLVRLHPLQSTRIWSIRYRITVLPPATGVTQVFDYVRISGIMLMSGTIPGNYRTGYSQSA